MDLIKDGGIGESGMGREPNAPLARMKSNSSLLGLDVVTATADSHASSDSSAKVPGQESGYFDSAILDCSDGNGAICIVCELAHDDSMQSAAGGRGLQSSIGTAAARASHCTLKC